MLILSGVILSILHLIIFLESSIALFFVFAEPFRVFEVFSCDMLHFFVPGACTLTALFPFTTSNQVDEVPD
jgi:hypothetical protein